MAPARSRNLKNNADDPIHQEKRERNNKAVRKTRAKKKIERDQIPNDINNLTNHNYFLAGQIEVNRKNLSVYINSAGVEALNQTIIDVNKLVKDSKTILERYKITTD